MKKFTDRLMTFSIYYIIGLVVLGLFSWVTLMLDDFDYAAALITATIVIIYDIVKDRRKKREEGELSVSVGLHLAKNKYEFMELNRNNEELIQKVRYMTDEQFQDFIKPYYEIFNENVREELE